MNNPFLNNSSNSFSTDGLTDAQLRAAPVEVTGLSISISGLTLSNVTVSGNVSVLNFPSTQAVSGNVNILGSVAVTGPLTDAQLRASAVPVSLSGTQLVSGNVNIIGSLNASIASSAVVLALQGGPPWLTVTPGASSSVQIVGTVPVSFSGATVSGNVNVLNFPATWAAALIGTGSVLASQVGTWQVSGNINVVNIARSLIGSGAVIAFQGSSPWLTSTPGGSSAVQIIGTTPVSISGTQPVSGNVNIVNTPAVTISGTGNQVGISAGTGVGWTPFALTGLTSLTTISSGACKFGAYALINLNSIPVYLQFFNVDQGTAVTVGTTAPDFLLPLPANSAPTNGAMANLEITAGFACGNGLKVAATTSPTGSGLVGTAIIGTLGYR